MNRNKYLLLLYRLVGIFEIVISLLLVVGIIIAIPDIFKYYINILKSPELLSYELFQNFLSHVLLLVIAVEFVVLMVAHSDTNIVHLIMLVIARKMLIYSGSMKDLLVAVIAIAILFIVRKFLLVSHTGESSFFEEDDVYTASMPIELLNKKYGFAINGGQSHTLGGYIYRLVEEQGGVFEPGEIIYDKNYIYHLDKVTSGLIETVTIEPITPEKREGFVEMIKRKKEKNRSKNKNAEVKKDNMK